MGPRQKKQEKQRKHRLRIGDNPNLTQRSPESTKAELICFCLWGENTPVSWSEYLLHHSLIQMAR